MARQDLGVAPSLATDIITKGYADGVYAPKANPTFTGTATTPALKVTGGTPGVGKILTSDASGNATWASQPGHTHVIPWQSEIVMASPATPRANGYVEGVGGVSVDKPITLRSVFVRVPDWSTMIGGTGNLNVQIYSGTTTAEGTLLATVVMAAGTNNILYNLPSASNIARDGILRAKLVINSTTGNGLQVQFRGDYQ